MKRLIVTGGGTGGHIFPLLVVAKALEAKGYTILYMGSRYGLEKRLVPEWGFVAKFLPIRGWVGVSRMKKLGRFILLPVAVAMAVMALLSFKPDVIFSTGGFASFPALAAARILGRPFVLLEQNASPGKVVEFFAPRSRVTCLGFADAADHLKGRTHVTGNPVRESFFTVHPMNLPKPPFHIVVVGGSQGSRFLNDLITGHLDFLASLPVRITHQTGPRDEARVKSLYAKTAIPCKVRAFVEEMPALFASADLLVSRAGAMSVSEIAASGRPALFIPFAGAFRNHQEANVRALVEAKGSWLLTEKEAKSGGFERMIGEILSSPTSMQAAGRIARNLAHRDSLDAILHHIEGEGGADVL